MLRVTVHLGGSGDRAGIVLTSGKHSYRLGSKESRAEG